MKWFPEVERFPSLAIKFELFRNLHLEAPRVPERLRQTALLRPTLPTVDF